MARVIALLFVVLVALAFVIEAKNARYQQAFEHFKDRYGKRYGMREEKHRYNIFVNNMKRADALNNMEGNLAKWGVTKFMDLSPLEFRSTYLMNETLIASLGKPIHKTLPRAPPRDPQFNDFDWSSKGAVTPVKNQGDCGSCWAFSAVETIESAWIIAGNAMICLSEQQIVDCDTTCYGCDGGWPYLAYEYIMQTGGDDTEASYPYEGVDENCQFNPSTVGATISNWCYVTQDCDETQMADFLCNTQPLSVCVDAETWQYYSGGIVTAGNCGTSIDHCVQITGIITEDGCQVWNVRNSWGTDWGENGYLWVQMGTDACAIAQVVTAVII